MLSDLVTALKNAVTAVSLINQTLRSTFPYTTGTSTSATAGAQTLPANPAGFIVITLPNGTINGGGSLIGATPFNPVMALNQADTNLMLVGGPGQDLYLSSDHADTFQSIGGVAGSPVNNITGTPTAIAFGTTQIRYAAYVATDDGNIAQSFDITSGGGNFFKTNFLSVAGGQAAFNIVMDPNNPLIAYAVTTSRVFQTVDGKTWTDITGNLAAFDGPIHRGVDPVESLWVESR